MTIVDGATDLSSRFEVYEIIMTHAHVGLEHFSCYAQREQANNSVLSCVNLR